MPRAGELCGRVRDQCGSIWNYKWRGNIGAARRGGFSNIDFQRASRCGYSRTYYWVEKSAGWWVSFVIPCFSDYKAHFFCAIFMGLKSGARLTIRYTRHTFNRGLCGSRFEIWLIIGSTRYQHLILRACTGFCGFEVQLQIIIIIKCSREPRIKIVNFGGYNDNTGRLRMRIGEYVCANRSKSFCSPRRHGESGHLHLHRRLHAVLHRRTLHPPACVDMHTQYNAVSPPELISYKAIFLVYKYNSCCPRVYEWIDAFVVPPLFSSNRIPRWILIYPTWKKCRVRKRYDGEKEPRHLYILASWN